MYKLVAKIRTNVLSLLNSLLKQDQQEFVRVYTQVRERESVCVGVGVCVYVCVHAKYIMVESW